MNQSLDIFITNTCDAMRSYGRFGQVKGSDGHIVVRVEKGGAHYYVYVLSDSDGKRTVRTIAGPYTSK